MDTNKLMIINIILIAGTITVILHCFVKAVKCIWKAIQNKLKENENNFWKKY